MSMNKKAVVVITLALVVLFLGCSGSEDESAKEQTPAPTSTPTPTPTATSTPTPTTTPTPEPTPEPIHLTGSGDTVSDKFTLGEGIAIFDMEHSGSSNYIIWLMNADTGERTSLLVNEIGSFDGRKIVGVTGSAMQASPGNYVLDISADGTWDITITQPKPTTGSDLPQTYTGDGYDVVGPFNLEKGLAKFEMSHDGNANFIVQLYDTEGNQVELLANEIGSYTGTKAVGVTGELFDASPGPHYLNIQADGDWEITVTQ